MIAIDPGKNSCAVAEALRRSLSGIKNHEPSDTRYLDADHDVIWERPQCDGRDFTVDDAIAVTAAGATLAGRIAGRTGTIREVTPREWKGSIPKPVHHSRLWRILTDAERALLGGGATSVAIVDACERGAADGWAKPGARYYRVRELATVGGLLIDHNILDAVALLMFGLGRLKGP